MGAITYPDLVKAVSEAARLGKRLGEYLVAVGLIEQEQMVKAIARQRMGEHRVPNLMAVANPTARDLDPVSQAETISG
jgi:hypothetical protein